MSLTTLSLLAKLLIKLLIRLIAKLLRILMKLLSDSFQAPESKQDIDSSLGIFQSQFYKTRLQV